MKFFATAAALLMLSAVFAVSAQDNAENEILEAYSTLQYSKAKRLAAKSERPEFRLIGAMCDVFDRRAQHLKRGMNELERLSKSDALPERYRSMAKLAYARAVHTLAMRKTVYPPALKVNVVPLYDEVIKTYPDTVDAVYAVVYRSQYMLDCGVVDETLTYLEKYIASYKGEPEFISPLHLMLSFEYIRYKSDYRKAVAHAEKARELGFSKPANRYRTHFRIARMYDVYLKDYKKAEKEYVSFLEKYPDTSEAVVTKRYLKELRERVEK